MTTALTLKSVLATAAMLFTPAGGYHGHYCPWGRRRRSVSARRSRTSRRRPSATWPGAIPPTARTPAQYDGPRPFAFEEPYVDAQHDGHYDPGDPFVDCNRDGRWDGNLLGGGGNTPRFFDHVADPVTARAIVVVQRPPDDRRRGRRPGGPVQRLPAADPRQGRARTATA